MPRDRRSLTYDEKKAAEAAFRGSPIDPKWSEAARTVYLGLSSAIANHRNEDFPEMSPFQLLPTKEVPLQYIFQPTRQPSPEEGVGCPFPFGTQLFFSSNSFWQAQYNPADHSSECSSSD